MPLPVVVSMDLSKMKVRSPRVFLTAAAISLAAMKPSLHAETVFESFSQTPEASGWIRIGDDADFDHMAGGWMLVRTHTSDSDQRFLLPLGGSYDQSQEFWFEFDWRPEAVYEWPRAYIGVMRGDATANADTIGIQYQRRIYAQSEEAQRGAAVDSSGSGTTFSTPNFPRPSGVSLDARTAIHYQRNPAGEGWLTITITDLASGDILATASGRVLTAAQTVNFDHIGISSTVSASRSPQYFDRMRMDNFYFSTEGPADSWFAANEETRPGPSWIEDQSPPQPNPLTWDQEPFAVAASRITMRATAATDDFYPVEYFFENIADPARNSGWQPEAEWTDTALFAETEYAYRVKARDKSPNRNETGWSPVVHVTTPAETDTSPPAPNPPVWETAPTVIGANRVTMTVAAAVDAEGNGPVQYYFANLTDPTHDSGWQEAREFTDWGLDYNTTYTYTVRARDLSGRRNETAPSASAQVTTAPEPALAAFLRDEGVWQSSRLGQAVAYSVYHDAPDSQGRRLPTIVYIKNSGRPRIGTEPDGSILEDLIQEQNLVIVLDFDGVSETGSRNLERALLEFHQTLPESNPTSILAGSPLLADPHTVHFLPAGYRIARNLPFWNVRDHGWQGTMRRVMNTYNGYVVDNFGVEPVTDPDDMRGPQGEEIDYNLYLDMIYPSIPEQPVPVLIDSSTNLPRMRPFGPDNERMIYPISFALDGYAWVSRDHCWNPLARAEYYGYWGQYSLDDWNGLISATAAVRFLRAHAGQYGLRSESIGIMGHSKGAYAATRLADPGHEETSEYFTFSGQPRTTPEPQPWPGYSSEVAVTFQSMGNGTRRLQYVTPNNVPTIIAVGRFDEYNHWLVFPELVERYIAHDLNHLALWMTDLNHDYPRLYDELYHADRFELVRKFLDAHLRPDPDQAPVVLYTFPADGAEDVRLSGRVRQLPPGDLLPGHASDLLQPLGQIAVCFAPAIDPASVADGALRLVRADGGDVVDGEWKPSRQHSLYRFYPAKPLRDFSEYEIQVSRDIRDFDGNPLAEPVTIRFRTGAISAGYRNWIDQFTLPPEARGALHDPFGTGISNLVAYALNLDPTAPDRGQLPFSEFRSDNGELKFDLTFPAPKNELKYTVEQSVDLTTWLPAATPIAIGDGWFRASATASGSDSLFLRLHLSPGEIP